MKPSKQEPKTRRERKMAFAESCHQNHCASMTAKQRRAVLNTFDWRKDRRGRISRWMRKLWGLSLLLLAFNLPAEVLTITNSSKTIPKINPQLLLLRVHRTTNAYPDWVGGHEFPRPTSDTNGIIRHGPAIQAVQAVAIWHPATTNILTHYVIGYRDGTNEIEITTITK